MAGTEAHVSLVVKLARDPAKDCVFLEPLTNSIVIQDIVVIDVARDPTTST
jgi:hypothetical protein